jgi:hypothetical protein
MRMLSFAGTISRTMADPAPRLARSARATIQAWEPVRVAS